MSRNGDIELPWPDQERTFRLGIGELRALQEKCNKGPMEILADLQSGRWRVDDIIQPIRLGLVGGGMKLHDAVQLIDAEIQPGRLGECAIIAVAILQAAITGPPDEQIKLPKGAKPGKTEAAADASTSKPSTRKGRSLDGPRAR